MQEGTGKQVKYFILAQGNDGDRYVEYSAYDGRVNPTLRNPRDATRWDDKEQAIGIAKHHNVLSELTQSEITYIPIEEVLERKALNEDGKYVELEDDSDENIDEEEGEQ